MKRLPATWKPVGEVLASPALQQQPSTRRTTTDGIAGDSEPPKQTRKTIFNSGRHQWLGQVVRDEQSPGAAVRVAVLLWEHMNEERGYAWPSLTYIAVQSVAAPEPIKPKATTNSTSGFHASHYADAKAVAPYSRLDPHDIFKSDRGREGSPRVAVVGVRPDCRNGLGRRHRRGFTARPEHLVAPKACRAGIICHRYPPMSCSQPFILICS